MALLGLGFRAISMAPAAIGPVKSMILSLPAEELRGELLKLIDLPDHSVRPQLAAFAAKHNISV